MKSLIISTICVLTIVFGWMVFMNHSESAINQLVYQLDVEVYSPVSTENWSRTDAGFQELYNQWQQHRKLYALFADHAILIDIDITFSQAMAFIQARSHDQVMGELAALREQFYILIVSDSLTVANVI